MNSGKIVVWMFIFEIVLFFIACFVSEDIRIYFSVLISNLYKKLVCNETIIAEYEGCTVHHSTKGPATYTPHFSYRIGYKRYHNVSCGSTISKKSMKKYEKGKEYKIYVDPNKPMIIAISKKLETSDLLMLFCTVGCVVYLIQYCRMVL